MSFTHKSLSPAHKRAWERARVRHPTETDIEYLSRRQLVELCKKLGYTDEDCWAKGIKALREMVSTPK